MSDLTAADRVMAQDILNLYAAQDRTQLQLDTLEGNTNAFVLAQTETNASINRNYETLSTTLGNLKLTLESHIATEAERVRDIVNTLLPGIATTVSALEAKTIELQTSLNTLKGRVDTLDGQYTSLQSAHTTLRGEYDRFVTETNTTLANLNTMLSGISTCTLSQLAGNKVTLTCGTTSVTLNTTKP